MSREIEFRGKRKDNKEWVYGCLIESSKYKDGHTSCWIIEKDIMMLGTLSTPTEKFIEVDPKTMGQYTGLKDKNCKKIYEGDIVLDKRDTGKDIIPRQVIWNKNCVAVGWFAPYIQPHWAHDYSEIGLAMVYKKIEIIGNIFDNPELLEEINE